MFDGLKDVGKLMKQAKEMKSQMKQVQGELKNIQEIGAALDEKIKVILTGDLDCVSVYVDPTLLDASQAEKIQKEITNAFNQALKKAKDTAASKLSAISGGLGLPGL
jgi:nucleoid-associated protein EbfC